MPKSELTEQAWSRLGLCLSRDVVERRFEERHKRQLNAGKAREIIAHLEQGLQYFTSAQDAGALAGPLEQYYGILAFARGLVLFLTPEIRETGLKKAHGLHAELPGDERLENIEISVQNGSFNELLEATGNVEPFPLDMPHPGRETIRQHIYRSLPRPAVGAKFLLVDLLGRIPGIRSQFEEAYGQAAQCFSCSAWMLGRAVHVNFERDRAALPTASELRRLLRVPEDVQIQNSAMRAYNSRYLCWMANPSWVGHLLWLSPSVGVKPSWRHLPMVRA